MNARHGNFLRDPFEFDHEFFGMSPREAKSMDPQQKLLLQGAVRALDDAGYVPNASPSFQSESMGCYIGVATQDYVQNLERDVDVYYSTGKCRKNLTTIRGIAVNTSQVRFEHSLVERSHTHLGGADHPLWLTRRVHRL